jgi:hypothetical protein
MMLGGCSQLRPRTIRVPRANRRAVAAGFPAGALDAAGVTDAHVICLLFLPWPRQVEIHYHRRMVAACRYALLVEVLDVAL